MKSFASIVALVALLSSCVPAPAQNNNAMAPNIYKKVWFANAGENLRSYRNRAKPGDLIIVGPGGYTGPGVLNLAKDRVNWYYYPGAMVTNTSAVLGGIYDNTQSGTPGALTFGVFGSGEFWDTTQPATSAPFMVSNAASIIHFQCKRIGNLQAADPSTACVLVRDCARVTLDIDECFGGDDPIPLWVDGGYVSGRIGNLIASLGPCIFGSGINPTIVDLTYDSAYASNNICVNWTPANGLLSRLILNGKEMGGSEIPVEAQGSTLWMTGGHVEINCALIRPLGNATFFNSIFQQDGGELHVNANEVQTTNTQPFMTQAGGFSDYNVTKWKDNGGGSASRKYNWLVAAGTNNLNGGRSFTQAGPGIKQTGGKVNVRNMTINTAGTFQNTNVCYWQTGGTNYFSNTRMISGSLFSCSNNAASDLRIAGTLGLMSSSNITVTFTTRGGTFLQDQFTDQ